MHRTGRALAARFEINFSLQNQKKSFSLVRYKCARVINYNIQDLKQNKTKTEEKSCINACIFSVNFHLAIRQTSEN